MQKSDDEYSGFTTRGTNIDDAFDIEEELEFDDDVDEVLEDDYSDE